MTADMVRFADSLARIADAILGNASRPVARVTGSPESLPPEATSLLDDAALALLAPPLRHLANAMAKSLARGSQARAQKRDDDAMWRHAQTDARVMNDIQVAMTRRQSVD